MPLKVEHVRPCSESELGVERDRSEVLFRWVYETIEQARVEVLTCATANGYPAHGALLNISRLVRDHGGTVELPDGSRITVEPIKLRQISREITDRALLGANVAMVCDAWNAEYGIGGDA